MSMSPVPVIAIGSSADGVLALRAIVAALPASFPAAVVILQHLADGREPRLPAFLARVAHLPVKSAEHEERLVAGTVYVARPGVHLVVVDGQILLEPGEKVAYSRPSTCCSPRSRGFRASTASACCSRAPGGTGRSVSPQSARPGE
jgi:two-component system chemotaxis response regulator CheB